MAVSGARVRDVAISGLIACGLTFCASGGFAIVSAAAHPDDSGSTSPGGPHGSPGHSPGQGLGSPGNVHGGSSGSGQSPRPVLRLPGGVFGPRSLLGRPYPHQAPNHGPGSPSTQSSGNDDDDTPGPRFPRLWPRHWSGHGSPDGDHGPDHWPDNWPVDWTDPWPWVGGGDGDAPGAGEVADPPGGGVGPSQAYSSGPYPKPAPDSVSTNALPNRLAEAKRPTVPAVTAPAPPAAPVAPPAPVAPVVPPALATPPVPVVPVAPAPIGPTASELPVEVRAATPLTLDRPLTPLADAPPTDFLVGYPQYLRSADRSELTGLALSGLAGILMLTAVGGLIGYRQAHAGHVIRVAGTARFLR